MLFFLFYYNELFLFAKFARYSNRLLRSRICQNFGYCSVDIFSPKSDRKFNFGSCKIFLTHERAESVDLFNLVPFECCNYYMGLDDVVFISRWVKNDFGNISRPVSPGSFNVSDKNLNIYTQAHGRGSLCLKFNGDDCKSEESSRFGVSKHEKILAICKQPEIDILEHFKRPSNNLSWDEFKLMNCPDLFCD